MKEKSLLAKGRNWDKSRNLLTQLYTLSAFKQSKCVFSFVIYSRKGYMRQVVNSQNFRHGTDIDLTFARNLTHSKEVKLLTELSFKKTNNINISKVQVMRDAGYFESNFNRSVDSLNTKLGMNISIDDHKVTGAQTHIKGNTFTTVPTYLIRVADKVNLTGTSIAVYWYINSATRRNSNVWAGNMDTLTRNLNLKLRDHGLETLSYDQVRRAVHTLKLLKLIRYEMKTSKHKITGKYYGRVRIEVKTSQELSERFTMTDQFDTAEIKIISSGKKIDRDTGEVTDDDWGIDL